MRDALERLYKTKLQLLAVSSTLAGVFLLVTAQVLDVGSAPGWLTVVPLTDVGSALFTTGLLAVAFEYIDRRDGDERAAQRLRLVLREEAPALRQAVYDALAFSPDGLRTIASPSLLGRITRNSLELQLGNEALAGAVYGDVKQQILDAPERWEALDVSATLTPWADGPAAGRGAMFVATVRTTYRTVPAHAAMQFACVSDMDEYHELQADPATWAWYFQPINDLDGASPAAFHLVQFIVDGHELPIRRTKRKGAQLFSVALGDRRGTDEVTITYTYRVLVQQTGHLMFLGISQPTNGMRVSLHYGDTGIRYVSALDFIASNRPVNVLRTPESVPARSVDIAFDGWVFARSGVAFVWVLDSEYGPQQARPSRPTAPRR